MPNCVILDRRRSRGTAEAKLRLQPATAGYEDQAFERYTGFELTRGVQTLSLRVF